MKVIDVDNSELEQFCSEVAIQISELPSLQNDCSELQVLVVGVASGGIPLAKILHDQISGLLPCSYGEVECRRPITKIKRKSSIKGVFQFLIKILPKFILNILRLLEHFVLSRLRNPERRVVAGDVNYREYACIIIVDDAVDSGFSLKAVYDYVASSVRKEKVYTVAYSVTQNSPVMFPDFYKVYGSLVRFPWAADV